MNKQWILEHLEQAEAAIVNAMYKAAGPQGPVDGQYYPQMDHNTLDRIIVLHSHLGELKTSLKGNCNGCRTGEEVGYLDALATV